jgi:serine/threonine protein kinase
MTGKARAPGTSDESFLDLVFERAVVLIESGTNPVAEDLLDGREHLRAEIEALLRTARQATLVAPETLPRVRGFVLEAEIGRGGMGTVYLARQEALGNRRVALKILPASALLSPRARERFVREARSIAHVRHPHVVTVHDVVAEADVCAYAMEWVDGASLSELIDHLKLRSRRPGALSGETRSVRTSVDGEPTLADVRELLGATAGSDRDAYPVFVCHIAVAIARALGELNRAGLVHRDVKPSNVLLRRDGTALLSDFGLVHETDGALTRSGQFVGTIAYASPEQLGGDPESLDARSDVYALGVTLYQTLTLHLPFDHRRGEAGRGQARSTTTPTGMLRLIESGRAAPLRAWNRRLPRDLETIVAKAMDPDRSRRYASADELADDLERMLNFQPIRARPAGPATRGVKLLRRNRAAALGIVGGSIVSLALATLVVSYAFLVPDWVRAHVREARLILLDPAQANDIFVAVLWGQPPGLLGTQVGDPALEEALAQYEAALRWSPFDEEIRSERDVVRAVLQPSQLSPTPTDDERGLRAAGLFAYLRGDVEAALRSWEQFELRHEPTAAPDPLVEAGLGVLCLVREEAARAYPRLRDACQALPDVAFLTTYQADAAVGCGDLDTAEQLLDAAAGMPRADPVFGTQRVRADLLAARGRDAEAEEIYRKICTKNGLATLHYARFLQARGRTEEAVDWYVHVAHAMTGAIVQREYVTALDAWWAGLTDEQRLQHVRSTLELQPTRDRWLVERLRIYLAAARIVSGTAGRVAPGSPDPGSGRDSQLSRTARDASSSRSLQRQPLDRLAKTLDVENMTRWKEIQRYPRVLDELQFWAWSSPWPHALSDAIGILAFLLDRRAAPAAVDESEETKARAVLANGRRTPSHACPDAPCFQGLGDLPGGGHASSATCLSADGTTVGGSSETSAESGLGGPGHEAFRWRADTGMVYLGDLPGSLRVGQVNGLSADGEVAVGWSSSGNGDNAGHAEREAFRWTEGGGMTGLGDVAGGGFESSAEAISDDGSVIAGTVDDGNCYRRGALWTRSGGWSIEDDRTPETGESLFAALSRDGRWAAGGVNVPCYSDGSDACRWSEASSFESLGVSYDGCGYAVSDLGEVAGTIGEGDRAFVTGVGGEILILGDLPGGGDGAQALGILPGGELIVGWASSAAGHEAVLWDESRALHRVADVLSGAGVSVPAGWVLTTCADITRNGRVVTLCGSGFNPIGDTEAWIARYELADDLHRLGATKKAARGEGPR